MNSDRIRVIVYDDVEEWHLRMITRDNHWDEETRYPAETDRPREVVYTTRDKPQNSKIHWIEDQRIGVNYILVKGPRAQEIADVLREKLEYHTSEEIMKAARDPKVVGRDRRAALYHLALDKAGQPFDKETFDIVKKAMSSKDNIVRGAAVTSTIYLGWKEFAAPLKALDNPKEKDESIRHDAALIASRLEAQK